MLRIFHQYVSIKTLLLVFLEAVLIAASILLAARLRFWSDSAEFQTYIAGPGFLLQCAVVIVTFQVCFYYNDFYGPQSIRGRIGQLTCVAQALGAGCLILGLAYTAVPDILLGRGVLVLSLSFIALLVLLSRICLDRLWEVAAPHERVLIVGAGNLALRLAREYDRRLDLNTDIIGLVALGDSVPCDDDSSARYRIFEDSVTLGNLVARYDVTKIIVALEDRRGALPIRDLVKLRTQGIRIEDAHTTMTALSGRVWLNTVRPSWFVFTDGFHRSRITLALKRSLDLIFACIGLVVSLPIMAVVALAVRLDSKGPIIYCQERVGWRGEYFEVLKFRSMRTDAEALGAQWASEVDPRVTRVGRILRKYRLDELPQFMNVIRGDMSFVGPRPERPVFVDALREHISYYDERHSVRPGLTGWAQVQYRYGASVEDAYRKLEYDLFYLQNMSIFFDCAIVLKTIRTVLTGNGAGPTKREYEENTCDITDCLLFRPDAVDTSRVRTFVAGAAGKAYGSRGEADGKEGLSSGCS